MKTFSPPLPRGVADAPGFDVTRPDQAVARSRASSRKGRKRQPLGSLHGDLADLAGRIQRVVYEDTMTVWADDCGDVFADVPAAAVDVPEHWIAGTFGLGLPLQHIEDDLRALLRERARNWIVD